MFTPSVFARQAVLPVGYAEWYKTPQIAPVQAFLSGTNVAELPQIDEDPDEPNTFQGFGYYQVVQIGEGTIKIWDYHLAQGALTSAYVALMQATPDVPFRGYVADNTNRQFTSTSTRTVQYGYATQTVQWSGAAYYMAAYVYPTVIFT